MGINPFLLFISSAFQTSSSRQMVLRNLFKFTMNRTNNDYFFQTAFVFNLRVIEFVSVFFFCALNKIIGQRIPTIVTFSILPDGNRTSTVFKSASQERTVPSFLREASADSPSKLAIVPSSRRNINFFGFVIVEPPVG